jgi:hypothetical protein
VPADALTALDRPAPFREALGVAQHLAVPRNVGGVAAAAQHGLIAGHHLDRRRPLVRIHPDHDMPIASSHRLPLSLDPATAFELGGHRYLEPNNPLLSLSRPGDARPTQAK